MKIKIRAAGLMDQQTALKFSSDFEQLLKKFGVRGTFNIYGRETY